MARNIMEERLQAAAERNTPPPAAPMSRRPEPMTTRSQPSGLVLAVLVIGAFLALIAYSMFAPATPAPTEVPVVAPAVGEAPAPPQPTALPAPTEAPMAPPTAVAVPLPVEAPAPVFVPAAAPAAPVAPPPPVVYSELVPMPTEAPAVRSCANTGRGVCRGERP